MAGPGEVVSEVEAKAEGNTEGEMAVVAAVSMVVEMGIGMRADLKKGDTRSLAAEERRVVGDFFFVDKVD